MSEEITVTLSPERLTVVPGESASARVTVRNTGNVVEAYAVVLEGIDPKWGALDVSSANLFPGDEESFELTIRPPRTSGSRAGIYEVRVNVSSRRDPSVRTIATLPVEVAEFSQFEVGLRPGSVSARRGLYTLSIANSGNGPASYSLSGQDDQKLCRFLFDDGVNYVEVQPGTTREVKVVVDPVRKPLAWRSQTHQFRVSVLPQGEEGAEARVVEAELECVPRVSRLGVLAGIGTLIVVVALLVCAYQFHWGGLGGTRYELQVTYYDEPEAEKVAIEKILDDKIKDILGPGTITSAYTLEFGWGDASAGNDERDRAARFESAVAKLAKVEGIEVVRMATMISVKVDACGAPEGETVPLITEEMVKYIDWSIPPWHDPEEKSFRFWTITSEGTPTKEQSQALEKYLKTHSSCATTSYWLRVFGSPGVPRSRVKAETDSALGDIKVVESGKAAWTVRRMYEGTVSQPGKKDDLEKALVDDLRSKDGIIWTRDATYVRPEVEDFVPPQPPQ